MKQFCKSFAKLAMAAFAIMMLAWGLGVEADAAASYLNPYDKAPYEQTSPYYSLKVDGQAVDVVTYFEGRDGEFAYAHLAYEGTATFEITSLAGSITNYNLSPHSYGYEAAVDGSKMTFDLTQAGSRYIILQADLGGTRRMLVIACDPREDYEEYLNVDNVVNVVDDYGADPTGSQLAGDLIQQAINDVSAAGGGTVYVPKGVYKIVYIDAADNVTLYLDEGAFLRGTGDRNDYTWDETGANGRQGRRDLDIKDSENFKVVGRGVIDGNSLALVQDKTGNGIDGWDDFRKGIVDGNGASGFVMDGVTVKDATGWTFSVAKSSDITIQNVKLLADYGFVHSDGYDFTSCNGVYIGDCLGICGDDVFCPKAQHEEGTMTDYLIENGVAFAHGGAGCKVGMQARCYTDNIVFRNIDVVQGYRGFTIAHDTGSGNFTNIVFEDIRTEKQNTHTGSGGQFRSAPFVLWTLQGDNNGSYVDGVQVTRCSFETFNRNYPCIIQGSANANSWVRNVTFTDCTIAGVLLTELNYTDYVVHGENVENIKYNSVPNVETASYEAEEAVLTAGTAINDKSWASGGQTVGNIGLMNEGTETESVESVTFTVSATADCSNDITIFCAVKGTRSYYVTVNGGEPVEVEFTGTDWNTLVNETVTVDLKAGDNEIVISNPTAAGPNLDRITVTHIHTQEEGWSTDDASHWKTYTCGHPYQTTPEAHADEDTNLLCDVCGYDMEIPEASDIISDVYEAENAVHSDPAIQPTAKNWASGGYSVGNVGLMDNGVQSLTFTVPCEAAGTYELVLRYVSRDNNGIRSTTVIVNGEATTVECSGTGWDNPIELPLEVELVEGENTIVLTNETAAAPNFDCIYIRHTHKYDKTYDSDEGYHWRAANCGHDLRKDVGTHYDENGDTLCDICAREVGDVVLPKPGPTGAETTVYEAEDAVHSDPAVTRTSKSWASGGYIMGNVGLMDNGVQSLTFTVPSDAAGTHTLILRYVSRDNNGIRSTTVIVNGEATTVECSGTGWDNPIELPLEVELVEGDNTIVLTNETGAAPNFDCISIVHTHAYAENWSSDENIHWQDATCGHDYKTNAGLHLGMEDDVCDTCGYTTEVPFVNPFIDVVETDYFYDAAMWAAQNGITTGENQPDTFNPKGNCTRAQVVTFLWRMAGNPEPETDVNPFADVTENSYYYKAVLWAVEKGITNGTTDTTFSPNETCIRAQVATFLWRYAGEPESNAENPFVDLTEGMYYIPAVIWAVEQGITTGDGEVDTFNPYGNCTRNQIVTFLYRYAN